VHKVHCRKKVNFVAVYTVSLPPAHRDTVRRTTLLKINSNSSQSVHWPVLYFGVGAISSRSNIAVHGTFDGTYHLVYTPKQRVLNGDGHRVPVFSVLNARRRPLRASRPHALNTIPPL